MGTAELVFTVLAFAAPLATVSGLVPLVISFNGSGAPGAFVAATLLLLFFAAGLAAMSKQIQNPGAFYAYVTAGLGRPLGLGSALLAIYSYWLIAVASFAFLGSASSRLVAELGGPSIPWYAFEFVGILLCGVLGYLNIELSAKVLVVVMVLEVVIVVILDVAIAGHGGAEGLSLEPLSLSAFSSGSVGVAILFGVLSFLGFESTAIYREEARNPERTIPRAMYLSVGLIGVFYTVSTLMIMLAYGADRAVAIAGDDPAALLTGALRQYLGDVFVDVGAVLLTTSVLASMVAVQNMLSRYLYSLGHDAVLPARFGSTHPRHRSPHVASMAVTGALLAGAIPSALSGMDPMSLYGYVAGVGSYSILVLMFLAVVAVVVYFRRHSATGVSIWQTAVLPTVAALGLATVVYLATVNFETLSGVTGGLAAGLIVLTFLVVVAGVLAALRLRSRGPEVYRRIGCQEL
ncbi:APC family permease [Saccharopolyspora karakumensis]|nr:APC family permease [Saccharopolyspora karakumensis]